MSLPLILAAKKCLIKESAHGMNYQSDVIAIEIN
jgi:hypothetical protein